MTKINHKEFFSPVLINSDWPVNIGLFRQKDHEITMLHYHEYLEIGYCYEGAGIFIIGDTVYPYNAGAAILIPPYLKHLAQSLPNTQSVWRFVTIHFDLLAKQDPLISKLFKSVDIGLPLSGGLLEKNSEPSVSNLMKLLMDNITEASGPYKKRFSLHLIDLILTWSNRLPSIVHKKSLKDGEFERVQKAVERIGQCYAQKISLADLAKLSNLSIPQFRRVFEKALGKSPQEYINEVRMEMAMLSLQNTRHSILDVSLGSGFSTLSSFNRLFLKYFGCTPRQARADKE